MAAPITYLIPTHERHGYLRRALAYYEGVDADILVADSSAQALPEAEQLPARVQYRHFPGQGYMQKLSQVAQLVTTPFVVLCADDDFTVPRAVAACQAFLESNAGYASAQGDYLNAQLEPAGIHLRPAYPQALQVRVDAALASERLLEVSSPYVPVYYAVHRTESLRDYARLAQGLENYNLLEMLFGLVAAIHGKHARLPMLYGVREVVPSVAAKDPRRRHGLDKVSTLPEYAAEYGRFVTGAAGLLAQRQGLAQAEAEQAVRDAVALFASRYCGHQQRRSFWRKLPKYLRRLRNRVTGRDPEVLALRAADEHAVRELLSGHESGEQGKGAVADLSDILLRMTPGAKARPMAKSGGDA
ncbi:MAG TPA: TIGR00180 family glycosyltransferase [Humidesulfovibrio sp.]|uniref:TIGR00180 family glycosyltransferase n=1 Tax=Humidesulfovibrio sp. TaxID=2910988 RepID=UPI002B5C641D|nr:TIGR00180 family glycosyltransferase [Humidesulfovibrio sp.]HWR02770.1 TIGR00180 family glycosyltransferase [Humidesulfovibrio sp.]